MRYLVIATALVLLGGCVSAEERAYQQGMADHSACQSYGFAPGSEGYSQCRMSTAQQRDANRTALIGAYLMSRPQVAPAPVPVYQMPVSRPSFTNCLPVGSGFNCMTQ